MIRGPGIIMMMLSFFPGCSHRIPLGNMMLHTEGLRDSAQGAEEGTANSPPCTDPNSLPICDVQPPPSKEVSIDSPESHGEAERMRIKPELSPGSPPCHCDAQVI